MLKGWREIMPPHATRLYEIDLLRFIAAMAVFLYHCAFRGRFFNIYTIDYPDLAVFCKYGFLGVDFFFIISGFVILMSVQGKTPSSFVQSRCIRLFPAFWLAASLTALVCLFWGPDMFKPQLGQYLLNLTMLSGFLGVESIDGVYWTLFVEILFYIFVLIILLLKQLRHIVFYLSLWLIFSFISAIIYIPWIIQYVFILNWACYFVAGAVLFLIMKNGMNRQYAALLLSAYGIAIYRIPSRFDSLSTTYATNFSVLTGVLLVTGIFVVMTLVALRKIQLSKRKKLIAIFGSISYPVYLIHHNAGFVYMANMEPFMNKHVVLGTLFIIVMMTAYGITLYEKRMSSWMRNILQRSPKTLSVS